MKRYEALFILHNPTKEDGIKEAIDLVTNEISNHGGNVETVQKMDRKPFARVASKKVNSGFYTNVIFEANESDLATLRNRFAALEEVFRVLITEQRGATVAPVGSPAEPSSVA